MKLLIDANLIISYLLNPESATSPIPKLMTMILSRSVDLVVPTELLIEIGSLRSKPYLATRILADDLDDLLNALAVIGESVSLDGIAIPRIVRDKEDDYLIAAAILANVDILVSGDKDLLALSKHLDRPRIMSPAEFITDFATS